MRHFYKRISMVAMTLLVTLGAMAQTAYVLTGTANRKVNDGKSVIYAFDVKTPWVATEICYADTTEGCFGVMGCLVGDTYYAYMETESDAGTVSTQYCSLNMTTGNKVILGRAYDLDYAIDMCYDEVTEKMYLLQKEYVVTDTATSEGHYVMQLCTVNPATGRTSAFATLPDEATDYKLAGITPDGNGNLYMLGVAPYTPQTGENPMFKFWYKQLNLYSFNLNTKELSEVFVNESAAKIKLTTDFVSSSLGLHEGVLYLTMQSNFISLDIATKTATLITQKGSGNAGADDAKLLLGEGVGICFAKSSADAAATEEGNGEEEEDTRLVRVIETYGDHMGERVGQMTHKRVYLYDGNNRLQREATYGYSYTGAWEIEYFSNHTYNEAGQQTMTFSQKYGIYDGTDLAFVDNGDTVTYEYDEAGNMVKKSMQAEGYNMLYEYNEAGQLVKEIKQVPDYYDQYEGDYYTMYEITYSAFNAFGQPDSIHSTGIYDTEKYFGAYTYDNKGRKVGAHTWLLKDTSDVKIETWTYYDDAENNDTVMVYWVHEWFYGFDQGEKRTVQTYDNGNVNRIKTQSQTLANGTWVNEATYSITEMSEMNPEAVATLEVMDGKLINQELKPNSAVLTITMSDAAVTGTMAFDVYRHGILLTRLNAADAVEGKLTYIDEEVKNGTYDYYVQTVLVNELLETEEALNISNVETYTHYVELPKVLEVECISIRLEGDVYYATVAWRDEFSAIPLSSYEHPVGAPVDMEKAKQYGFLRYNVMLENMKAADNAEADGQDTSWEVNCGPTGKVNLYIQTVYKYGKANSDMISIDCQKIAGIESIVSDAAVTVNAGVVSVSAPARIAVYNVQGAQVADVANATSLNLNTLPAGLYLVKVETAEGVKTVKVRL